jgi:hypothetical protein
VSGETQRTHAPKGGSVTKRKQTGIRVLERQRKQKKVPSRVTKRDFVALEKLRRKLAASSRRTLLLRKQLGLT